MGVSRRRRTSISAYDQGHRHTRSRRREVESPQRRHECESGTVRARRDVEHEGECSIVRARRDVEHEGERGTVRAAVKSNRRDV